jgi:murein L,D-transpeptidase YafK
MSRRVHAIILSMNHRILPIHNPNRRRAALILGSLLALAACFCMLPSPAHATEDIAAADRVVVRKAEHKLYLYSGDRLLGEYRVQLGLSPAGQKEREHDFRTPEGRYYLARRNPRSEFFLAIQVSYPNKEDELRARKNRWAPGGLIMIHGFPNQPKHPATYYASNDWTDGCIALSNSDMVEVWMRTQDNIPIDIYP